MADKMELAEPEFVDVVKGHPCRFFRIERVSELNTKKRVMRDVKIGKHTWHVTVSAGFHLSSSLSAFIKVPENAKDYYRPIQFQFSVVNQKDQSRTYTRETNKVLNKRGMDWGFKEFFPLEDLYRGDGFAVDDTVIIGMYIYQTSFPRRAKRGAAATGHVGLRNQGATCYMNSLLQSLFFIGKFRKLVFDTALTEKEGEKGDELVKGLRQIFYRLQFSPRFVDTLPLTRALGWDLRDAFMQHDVQEFSALLIDKLENQLKGTDHEKELLGLFEGSTLNYIKCVNVDYQSNRKETIREIQLSVKGCDNIYESFEKYCREEKMEGDNKYDAEGHGLQDAVMGVKFGVFPPVLQLHLMRYEYDPHRDAMVKIHDKFEFEEELDLSPFVAKQEDAEGVCYKYTLHSVMVHSGDGHAGHYRAFIRVPPKPLPTPEPKNGPNDKESSANGNDNGNGNGNGNGNNPEPMDVDAEAKDVAEQVQEADKDGAPQAQAQAKAGASSEEDEEDEGGEDEVGADGRRWLIFDDELVYGVRRKHVFEQSFGGPDPDGWNPPFPLDHKPSPQTTSAYMLVYIRDEVRDQLLCEIPEDAIPRKVMEEGAFESAANAPPADGAESAGDKPVFGPQRPPAND